MKVLPLLLLAGLLSAETAEAAVALSPSAEPTAVLVVGPATSKLFVRDAAKRRKRGKSRPAYKRLGIFAVPAVQYAVA